MSTEAIDATTNEPSRFTSLWCRVGSCNRPVDGNVGGPYCVVHRRTFRFSATLNDALTEFLSGSSGFMNPTMTNANDVREAGELFALGLSKMFGAAFGVAVLVDPAPIAFESVSNKRDDRRLRWHVSLRWQEDEGDSLGYAAMDEDDELHDEYNDDENGDEDE